MREREREKRLPMPTPVGEMPVTAAGNGKGVRRKSSGEVREKKEERKERGKK